jgi:polyhydroxybutyrate depolymerase
MTKSSSWRTAILALSALFFGAAAAQADCGKQKGACKVASGSYHVSFPAGYDSSKNYPAVVALHSWGGTGQGLLRSGKMVRKLLARGYVVIAPEGLRRAEGTGNSWEFRSGARRNDASFIISVADDAAQRFGLNRGRMMLAGFSVGGSMVHYTACKSPGSFKGYAPVSGNFWKPYPGSCGGGANILHSHGRADNTMPFAGRKIRPGLEQGSLATAMDIWSKANGCQPAALETQGGGIARQRWSGCNTGSIAIDYYPGGHSVPGAWADRAISWFEGQ